MALVCSWDLTDDPLGQENFRSTLYVHHAASRRLLHERTSPAGPTTATSMAAGGSVLTARVSHQHGWVLDGRERHTLTTLTLDPHDMDHNAVIRTLVAVEDQVLVVDAGRQLLRTRLTVCPPTP